MLGVVLRAAGQQGSCCVTQPSLSTNDRFSWRVSAALNPGAGRIFCTVRYAAVCIFSRSNGPSTWTRWVNLNLIQPELELGHHLCRSRQRMTWCFGHAHCTL